MIRWFLPVSLIALLSVSAGAMGFCTEPTKPYCVDQYGTFEDEWSFEQCKGDVSTYVRRVKDYAECLEQERQDAILTAQKVIKKFNCKAEGNPYCP